MTPEQFTQWRELLGMTKTEACKALGCSPNTITAYELGRVEIPQYIALACRALANGLRPWGEEAIIALVSRKAVDRRIKKR